MPKLYTQLILNLFKGYDATLALAVIHTLAFEGSRRKNPDVLQSGRWGRGVSPFMEKWIKIFTFAYGQGRQG